MRCDHVHNVVALDARSSTASTDCRARRLLTHVTMRWQETHTLSLVLKLSASRALLGPANGLA